MWMPASTLDGRWGYHKVFGFYYSEGCRDLLRLVIYAFAVLNITNSSCCFIFVTVSSSPSRNRIYNGINARNIYMER